MTREDKQLLLRDICARLPYGVMLNCAGDIGEKLKTIDENGLINNDWDINEIKPYLRPMSSMTEEEEKEICQFMKDYNLLPGLNKAAVFCGEITDWLNKKMFDYHGLISKDLAISI